MKKFLTLFLIFTCTFLYPQDFRYLGVGDGLSNRRVYSIQKDENGYMWFLTQDGIDRFNGTDFKNYKLFTQDGEIPSSAYFKKLFKNTTNNIWEITQQGILFEYNVVVDKFEKVADLTEYLSGGEVEIRYVYFDKNDFIWLCTSDHIFHYDIKKGYFNPLDVDKKLNIREIVQMDENTYFVNASGSIYKVELEGQSLKILPSGPLKNFYIKATSLYYHPLTHQLIIGTYDHGIYVYNDQTNEIYETHSDLSGLQINCIHEFTNQELLIATESAGIYKMDVYNYTIHPYLTSDFEQLHRMNGNNIKDIYIDEEKRIWMANYPIGITIFDERYPQYKWIKHSHGNRNSLINDQVNYILEDADQDIWYATNNGISLFHTKSDTWNHFLSSFHSDTSVKNHIFLCLCEVLPGKILAGGYMKGVYLIDKSNSKLEYLVFQKDSHQDRHVRAIFKDSNDRIWIGGNNTLKCIDYHTRVIMHSYSQLQGVNVIHEKDSTSIWVGCDDGLYLLDISTDVFERVSLNYLSGYVNTLFQTDEGILYIGTNNEGLISYNPINGHTFLFNKNNSTLISNTIHCILPNDENLVVSTEHSLTQFNVKNRIFRNWTKERGLITNQFNSNSGLLTSRGTYIFGSGEGALEFNKCTEIPTEYKNKIVFSDFQLFYESVAAGEKHSPLKKDINEVEEIRLNHNQNIFSINLSSINYDYPSNILYFWKLEGFYDEWNKPVKETNIRFTNLNPGKYTLRVRAISNEDLHVIEERSLDIIINRPFWATPWAQVLYFFLLMLAGWAVMRYHYTQKESKMSMEKIDFFVNTAHDIRTPLSLIKAPLDDILDNETLTSEGERNLLLAIRNTNTLYRLITNLLNFEKTNIYSPKLCIEEFELYSFLEESIKQFKGYADSKHIQLILESNFRFLTVWFDKAKMDSILKNLLSNAVKYTPPHGIVRVIATNNIDGWSVEVKDNGIGIPQSEQNKLFKMFFRGSNAVNSKVPGSGIGLLLVSKLVRMMKGKIYVKTIENEGSSFKVTFRHGKRHFKKYQFREMQGNAPIQTAIEDAIDESWRAEELPEVIIENPDAPAILVVDDNDELRNYLKRSLSDKYNVSTAANGLEALEIVKEVNPRLVIADIMMPEVRGDVLCAQLKNDINTSHIPVILLSALSDRNDILDGLSAKADEYVTKPFDIAILKVIISNLLENRLILAQKYAQLDLQEATLVNSSSALDIDFMKKVKESIEQNMDSSEFNVDSLCFELHMSRSSFYNKIKALTGQAPADFIRTQRMNRAAELLRTRKYTISQIADMVGFSDAKYFREVFKKQFNKTPSQYINEHEE